MRNRIGWLVVGLVAAISVGPSAPCAGAAPAQRIGRIGPRVDHHQHFLSPQLAPLMETLERGEPHRVELPPEIADLLRRRAAAWNDAAALGPPATPIRRCSPSTATRRCSSTI
jgi:hypothetical protein